MTQRKIATVTMTLSEHVGSPERDIVEVTRHVQNALDETKGVRGLQYATSKVIDVRLHQHER